MPKSILTLIHHTMITYSTSLKQATFSFAKVGVIAAALIVMALPNLSQAATFAYVNQSGNIGVVTADTWMSAIANAPGIAIHSGVILLENLFGTSGLTGSTSGV